MGVKHNDDETELSRPPQFKRTPLADGTLEVPSTPKAPAPAWTSGSFPGSAALARQRAKAGTAPQPLAVWPSAQTDPAPARLDAPAADPESVDDVVERTELLAPPKFNTPDEQTEQFAPPNFNARARAKAVSAPEDHVERTELLAPPKLGPRQWPTSAPQTNAPPEMESPIRARIDALLTWLADSDLSLKIALGAALALTLGLTIWVIYVLASTPHRPETVQLPGD